MSLVTEWRKSRVRGYVSVVEPAAESVSQSVCECFVPAAVSWGMRA